ncbi:putative hydro-lyase [Bordetella petrii]|uniref:putative hydro-lyase n=1 Tax=Bordetella petrii TaxID=94624 RepID=UPI001E65703B|nr:putative hydro-lyase [Bordetella petrii]MCD0502909.1 putative hydro-lyase [Bordetella petrii]
MLQDSVQDLAPQRGRAVRMDARNGRLASPTAGLAAGNVQANLAILPAALAADFLLFCQRNPKACPLLAMSGPGDPALPELGHDIDIRTDLPRYRVWRHGELAQEPTDVRDVWRDDLVSFLIGCSFSFEEALLAEGIEVRHIACQSNAPMWRCSIPTRAAGPFSGPLVVSMRPFAPADAIRAIQITSRFPSVHGAPVHIGDPSLIGIQDLQRPDYGDAVPVRAGEIPVFWACGVTPQSVIATARPDLCITHAPGHMLVTDLLNSRLAVL